MAIDAKAFYDGYWAARERTRTEARSRERAVAALELLAEAGVRGGRLLDAGCGPGWALETFRDAGFTAVGVDASSLAVEEARRRGLDARVLDLETRSDARVDATSPLGALGAGLKLDVVVALEVLEHLADPLAALVTLRGFLAHEGRIVASLPNELALPARLRVLFGRLPFGGHDDPHVRHFDRLHALRLFKAAGLRVLAARPLSVVPPRWPLLRAMTRPALALLPGAFALATVYLLARIDALEAGRGRDGA